MKSRIGKAFLYVGTALWIFFMVNVWYFMFVMKSSRIEPCAMSKIQVESSMIKSLNFDKANGVNRAGIEKNIKVEFESLNTWLQLGEDYPNMYVYKTWIDGLKIRFGAIEDLYRQLELADSNGELMKSRERFYEARDRILFGVQSNDQVMINIGMEILNGIEGE